MAGRRPGHGHVPYSVEALGGLAAGSASAAILAWRPDLASTSSILAMALAYLCHFGLDPLAAIAGVTASV